MLWRKRLLSAFRATPRRDACRRGSPSTVHVPTEPDAHQPSSRSRTSWYGPRTRGGRSPASPYHALVASSYAGEVARLLADARRTA